VEGSFQHAVLLQIAQVLSVKRTLSHGVPSAGITGTCASCACQAVAGAVSAKRAYKLACDLARRGNHQHLVQRATAAQAAIEEQRRLQQQRLQEAQAAEQQYKQLLSRLDPANACAPRMSPGCCPLPWVWSKSACLRTFCMAGLGIRIGHAMGGHLSLKSGTQMSHGISCKGQLQPPKRCQV